MPGISEVHELDAEIGKLSDEIGAYETKKERLTEQEKNAKEAFTEASVRIAAAGKETNAAKTAKDTACQSLEKGLKENGFVSTEQAEKMMLSSGETEELSAKIASFDANLETAKETLRSLREELSGKEEPEEELPV